MSIEVDRWIYDGTCATTLEQFEELVLSQKAATQAWTPVTDYSFEARQAIEGDHPRLIQQVFALETGHVVVDAGCGRDGHLVRMLRDLRVFVLGFDPSIPKQSIDPALNHGDLTDRRFMDGEDSPWADLVICREVLEHLRLVEARLAIRNLCLLSKRYVYITTRFSSEHDLLRVETADDLDPTHINLPAKDLYRLLLTLEGFKRRDDLETQMDWQQKGRCLVYERV